MGVVAPWTDTWSAERTTWRERAAWIGGDEVFAVDYQVCPRCRLGWVEQPWTHEEHRRSGLAAAGLSALRNENPGFAWHTLGGHMPESRGFWAAVGDGVIGAYARRSICSHRSAG